MDPSGVACTNCGKNMTTDDLRRTACVHCGQVLAHHARAAQQVAVVNQMLAQGMPQQLMAQQYGQGMYGQQPPGGFGQPMMGPGAYYGAQMNQVQAGVQKAAISAVVIAVVIAVVVLALVVVGVAFALIMVR
jgi:hypothetical protein